MSLRLRTTCYSVTLALAVTTQGFGIFAAVTQDFSPHQNVFGTILFGISFVSWIWISVLLAYNNRPASTHAISKARVHFYSFMLMVPLFLAVGIMLLTQVSFNCNTDGRFSDGEAGGWCADGATGGALSILISISAALSAWAIRRSVATWPAGLQGNIAAGDSQGMESGKV